MKSAAEFSKRKASADGLALYCKECFALRNAATYRKRQARLGKKTRTFRRHSAVPEGMKYCAQCQETKPVGEFGKNRAAASGLTTYCRPCHNKVMAETKQRLYGSDRNYLLKLRYGLTEEQVDQMIVRQGGVCVICLRAEAKQVDHSHLTGVVRGILCFRCNGALGQFHDDPRCLGDAADYVELRGPHARRMRLELDAAVMGGPERKRRDPRWSGRSDSVGTARHYHLRQKYGINDEDARWLLGIQGGLCAVCWDVPAEHVDHDHISGAVRGMACGGCNTGMGQLDDDPVSLRRAADYVLGRLVTEVPAAGGGTRLSFTLPDVDPGTVPVDGWAEYREADGRHRSSVWRVDDDHEGPTWLTRGLRDLTESYRTMVEEYAGAG
ncbi:endonuclease VII domain-containing protein [Actinomadura graeca]|uniref:Endonuclease VII domain-containing protein n=1 Tax=Actinomadura graeca TaxID=2750812 RepID=A0ABX8QR52_9ACTN|nr:endonuclease VII domain-containing protein [Actinomadura graeca]QXJ19887.1 endonuclease VII domain-containing protein [Actinomadura graeca]